MYTHALNIAIDVSGHEVDSVDEAVEEARREIRKIDLALDDLVEVDLSEYPSDRAMEARENLQVALESARNLWLDRLSAIKEETKMDLALNELLPGGIRRANQSSSIMSPGEEFRLTGSC